MHSLKHIQKEIRKHANKEKAKISQSFFKTGKGEYSEGDIFLGLTVPISRTIVKRFSNTDLKVVIQLLKSKIHEDRLIALLIMVDMYERDEKKRDKIFGAYLKNTRHINNWDLVDSSADKIVGAHLEHSHADIRNKLATSKELFERRIAMISTFHDIKKGKSGEALRIAEMLLEDGHDLMHKAVGWMLREVGKRCSEKTLIKFLKTYYKRIPRTALRYAIERFPEKTRKQYLVGKF
jgi:3-methyladenine DNA glycosylase AlkD